MREIITIFMNYAGNGIYPFLFIAAVIYLLITEKERRVRILLAESSAAILVLFFIPLFKLVIEKVEEAGTYYRILWLLPMTVVIAYASVKLIAKHTRIGLIVLLAVLILGGSNVYKNPNMSPAQNRYKVPNDVVAICDLIKPAPEQERIWTVFPSELIHFVRQYSSDTQMLYGRDMFLQGMYLFEHPIYTLMEADQYDVEPLAQLLTDYQVQYVILNRSKPIVGDPAACGLELVGTVGGYEVYRNLAVPLWMKGEEYEDWSERPVWWEEELEKLAEENQN